MRRLTAAGAILVGALNMDEYAYGFSTENTHYGPTRNPHDPLECRGLFRGRGGSGRGFADAVDPRLRHQWSIRVPAAICGVFGLRPTYGRLSRSGMRLFSASLDVGGPFARTAEDLALVYDALQGPDPEDPACAGRSVEPALPELPPGT